MLIIHCPKHQEHPQAELDHLGSQQVQLALLVDSALPPELVHAKNLAPPCQRQWREAYNH